MRELDVIKAFADTLPTLWKGEDAYTEMLEAGFPDALQSEWPGFYLEYLFQKFIATHPAYQPIARYAKDKKKGLLDFDVAFKDFHGDLKAHSLTSSATLGNDMRVVDETLKEHGRLWYIVVHHTSVKDSTMGHVVTRLWNNLLNKHRGAHKDPLSYGKKMKYSAAPTEIVIAEINKENQQYLTPFNQGRNSNGKPREVKVKIDKKDEEKFIIFRKRIG